MGFAEVLITLCVVALILLIVLVIGIVVVMNASRAESPGKKSGPASGDLAGEYPAPMVSGLRGLSVSPASPADGQVLAWNAAAGEWQPRSVMPGMLEAPPPAPPEELELNAATAEELTTIPGVGPELAERIIAARDARGGFSAIEDLLEVRGVGQALLGRIKDRVRLSD